MADTPVVVTTPSFLDDVRDKTFEQILQEQAAARPTESVAAPVVEDTDEDKKKKDEAQAAQEAKAQAEADKKHDEEIATKAAHEVIEKQKAEEQAKSDAQKAEEAEKQRLEDLKPHFTGKDKDGNTVPLSYEELHAEDVRVAEERAVARIHAEQDAKERAQAAEAAKAAQTKEQQHAAQKAIEEQLQKELDSDLKSMYAAGDMPKIGDPKDENDAGNKAFKHLFETAQKVNGARIAQGLAPVRSIQLIRYGKDEQGKPFYTPLAKPAGSEIQVLGNESPLSHEAPDDQYIPARDRNKSMLQLIREEAARRTKKLNIRGS